MKYNVQHLPGLSRHIKKIFFVGIKGVGVCPLAIISKQAGLIVAGSDIEEQFITDVSLTSENIQVFTDFNTRDISSFFDTAPIEECLVITTGAHKGFENPQVIWAKEKGIVVVTQGQALGLFMKGDIFNRDFKGISIAGSHGKTTISGLLSTCLSELGLDPTYTVGTGQLFPVGSPGHFGKGEYFVAEADEYASEPVFDKIPKFLYQNPSFAIFNNIDFDHPDIFENVEDIVSAFSEFALNIKSHGKLIVNGDDKYLKEFKKKVNKDIKIISFGQNPDNDYVVTKIVTEGFSSRFTVLKNKQELGVFELSLPGKMNALNALSVIAFLFEIGVEPQKIRQALKVFKGSKRRMEVVGTTKNGATLIDDYGHHPTEITTTIGTIRNAYPDKKIVAIFQPHTYSRTKALLPEFGKSFSKVSTLILLPIFKSQRDSEHDTLSNEEYVRGFDGNKEVLFLPDFASVVEYVNKNFDNANFIIITIGAGDVYKIAYKMLKK